MKKLLFLMSIIILTSCENNSPGTIRQTKVEVEIKTKSKPKTVVKPTVYPFAIGSAKITSYGFLKIRSDYGRGIYNIQINKVEVDKQQFIMWENDNGLQMILLPKSF